MPESDRRRIPTRRKRKPRSIAVVTEACSGCGGSPVCQLACPVDGCMVLEPAPEAPPFQRIRVDPLTCIGCKSCTTRGPAGILLTGCPWDAITMVDLAVFEAEFGELPY